MTRTRTLTLDVGFICNVPAVVAASHERKALCDARDATLLVPQCLEALLAEQECVAVMVNNVYRMRSLVHMLLDVVIIRPRDNSCI